MSGGGPFRSSPVGTASLCAALMIATQVAGKAARDSLFLTNFSITALPVVLAASAVLSIGAVLLATRVLARHGPSRVVPPLFVCSGVLLVGEWLLAASSIRVAAVLVYMHVAILGAILISGFWSIINENFDPRAAKRGIGKIVGGASAGGLLGGLIAERLGAFAGILWLLPAIAVLQTCCAGLLVRLRGAALGTAARPAGPGATPAPSPVRPESGLKILRRIPYLRHVALLVLLGNLAATLVDFLFKARAAAMYTNSAELVRFFAIFYTSVSLVTLAVQAIVTRPVIERAGVAKSMAVRPGSVVAGGLLALPFMSLIGLGLLRGLEAVVQGSLYRSGYELLFTPVAPDDKRRTKTLIDVGADRLGDTLGGLIVRALLALPAAIAGQVILVLAAAVSFLGLLVARALHAGYVRALEASLLDRASRLALVQQAPPEMPSLMESFAGIDVSMSIQGLRRGEWRRAPRRHPAEVRPAAAAPARPPVPSESPPASVPAADAELTMLAELRSGDRQRVRDQLQRLHPTDPLIAAQTISLLAWDEVTVWASRALAKAAPAISGQLVDRLLDPTEDFVIRRRIPRILATATTEWAVAGLLAALADKRFEVRFQAGSALAVLHDRQPALSVDAGRIYSTVRRETQVERLLWEDQRLIDEPPPGEPPATMDAALRSRSSRSLEHVFNLLSVVLPRAPLQIAFQGLLTQDAGLRGTSLEYLESVLPRDVWESLRPLLGDSRSPGASPRERSAVLEELLLSRQRIEINLAELRKSAGER